MLDAWAAKAPSIDWAVAAAAGVAGETGERGLRLLGVQAGDTIFVDGGAGGVGAVSCLQVGVFCAGHERGRVPGLAPPGPAAGSEGARGAAV